MKQFEASELFTENEKLAHYWAARYVGLGAEAEDLDQTALAYLWEAALDYDPAGHPGVPFSAFCRTGMRRSLARAVGEAQARGFTDYPEGVHGVDLPLDLVGDKTLNEEMRGAVWAAVNRLEWPLMEITARFYGMDGRPPLSRKQCALEFGLSLDQVKRFLSRAKRQIQSDLVAAGWHFSGLPPVSRMSA
jgi:RNA polymerase sigma factor (sigma-70 family)